MKRATRFATAAAAVALTFGIAGCGSASSSETTASSEAQSAAVLQVADASVKVPSAEMPDMTGAFGMITNPTDSPVTIVSGSSPVAGMVELHEMAMVDGKMVMQQKEGGFPIAAGETIELKPGGNHIMLMDLKEPIEAGDMVSITLTTDTGVELSYEAMARPFSSGEENYHSG